jgi:hypothetical protein
LLGLDELAGARAARERAGGLRPAEVDGNRDPDEGDAEKLEGVAEPPPELHVVEHERCDEGGGEEREPEDDQEVGAAAGEEVGVDRPQPEEGIEEEARCEERECERAARLGDLGDDAGEDHADDAEERDGDDQDHFEHDQPVDALRLGHRRERGQREDGRAEEQRGAPGERAEPSVVAHDHAGRREAVEREQGRHGGEGRADENGARVVPPPAHDREGERRGRGQEGADADTPEVDAGSGHRLVASHEEKDGRGKGHAGRANSQCGRRLPPQDRAHGRLYRPGGPSGLQSSADLTEKQFSH